MRLELCDPVLFRDHIAPYLPSSDYYEIRSRFDNLRESLPLRRYMNWPAVIQEIVNVDTPLVEAELLSRCLRITPQNDPVAIKGCWSLVHLFLQNETCADCVKRSFLVLPIIHASIMDLAIHKGRLQDLVLSDTFLVSFVALYAENHELLRTVVHVTSPQKDDSFLQFSRECFTACVIFDKLEFLKLLLESGTIAPLKEMGPAVDIFTTVMSPKGLAGIDEPIPNNPFAPIHIKPWFDYVIDDCRIPAPVSLWGMIVDFGCIQAAVYFVEDRRLLMRMLYATGCSFSDLLDYASPRVDSNRSVIEYIGNLPYRAMREITVLSACTFDELQILRMILESGDSGSEINLCASYSALSDPIFTFERRNTSAIRSLLDSKKSTKAESHILHKKRSKRYCCY